MAVEPMAVNLEKLGITPDIMQDLALITSDPMLFCRVVLRIQDKMGRITPLAFNRAQMRLYQEYMRQRQEGRPVRIIILKARQMGFSTAVEGIFYWHTTNTENINTMLIAHKADASTAIFNKNKFFYDNEIPILQPMRKASNAKELLFENPTVIPTEKRLNPGLRSKIIIETAMNKEAGRSLTIHNLHVSELAFWPYTETMVSLMQAVPNEPGTSVIVESTANGIGGDFYEMWQQAVRGESTFVPLFFPWWQHQAYQMPVGRDFVADYEEKELKRLYGLRDEQLMWRRWCLANNCGGDIDIFHQEYPSSPEEAFIASGRPVFDVGALESALRQAADPPPERIGRVMDIDGRAQFQRLHNGFLKVWRWPEDGKEYVAGIDVALGKNSGDFSVIQVIERISGLQVAEWHGHIDPDLLGDEAALLGKFYNLAWLIPEANNMGAATVQRLRALHYPRLYRRMTINKITNKRTVDYGFTTTAQSKPLAIASLSAVIRENACRIQSPNALRECMTYVIGDDGRSTNAQNGCYDDRVMALAMAFQGRNERPWENLPDINPGDVNEEILQIYGVLNAITGY